MMPDLGKIYYTGTFRYLAAAVVNSRRRAQRQRPRRTGRQRM